MAARPKKEDPVEINSKNTKDQILSAYQDVLKLLEDKEGDKLDEGRKRKEEQKVVERASEKTPEAVITDLMKVKLSVNEELDNLSKKMMAETAKLTEIRQAIQIEQRHIEEVYEIKETLQTLSALLITHKEEKIKFKEEIECQREEWVHERLQNELEENETAAAKKKAREREEEDYTYQLALKRRKELDEYEAKRIIMEREMAQKKELLANREEVVKAQEQEVLNLRRQVEGFAVELAQAVQSAEKNLESRLTMQHNFEKELTMKEVEGQRLLSKQKIEGLEVKIREQEALINQLTQKAESATKQVESIACRALDVSSHRFNGRLMPEERTAV